MHLTIPTMITLFRILTIPVMVALFYAPYVWSHYAAAGIFIFGALTDWADGWIARRYNMSSAFGAFLDPVADKLAVAVALVIIVQFHAGEPGGIWMGLGAAVIIGREITISALREWMAELGERARVKVAWVGKVKTIAQMVAISCLLFREDLLGLPVFAIGQWTLAVAAILTLWSGAAYLHAAWPTLSQKK